MMDARRLTDNHWWDSERLRDIESLTKNATGSKYEFRVLHKLSSRLRHCRCVQQLLPYLKARGILTESDCAAVLCQSGSWVSEALVDLLVQSSSDPNKSEKLIEGLYLSLLDCYEREGEAWCWETAVHNLWSVVLPELCGTPLQRDYSDVRVAVSCLPPVQLPVDVAAKLLENLNIRGSVESSVTDLKELIQYCLSTRKTMALRDLVSGLLLTPGLGRYTTHLVPYCLSNSPEVYHFVFSLKFQWKMLASYLGYTGQEVNVIVAAGLEDLHTEIQLFLRVWWVPDCGKRETEAIIQTVQPAMNLWLHDGKNFSLEPKEDDGQALLETCVNRDWNGAAHLIQSGSYLGARDEDGKTPLMHACLKGNERIIRLLIERGADPQDVDERGNTCLHFLETLTNQTILKLLLEIYETLGISVDPESVESGCTPLSIACKHEAVNSVETLLEHNANPNGSGNGHHRPLVEASARGHMRLVKILLKHHADIDLTDSRGYTPLLQACTSNHWSVAQLLMEEGANVNKCGLDYTSPLFAAVMADSYGTASRLIQKGACVDIIRYQPGAQEGIVEVTPLAHAAAKGMTAMVDLLINSGANVNYLCSGTMPPIGFSIIHSQFDTFKQLLSCPSLDRSLLGFSTPIVTSVMFERYIFTEILLVELGGPEVALKKAQQNRMSTLEEHIVMFMQTRELMKHQPLEPPPPQLQQDTDLKAEEVLYHFCQICVAAVLDNEQLNHESVVEIAAATDPTVAQFLKRVFSHTQRPETLKHDFLHGDPSPFTFLIQSNILTADMFQIEALSFYMEGAEGFYEDLLWTFHQMPGGEELPTDIQACLTQLFSDGFTPYVSSESEELNPSPFHRPAVAAPHSEGITDSSINQETNSSTMLDAFHKSTQKMCTKLSNVHKQISPIQARPTGEGLPYEEVLADTKPVMKQVQEASLINVPQISEAEGEDLITPSMQKSPENTKPSLPKQPAAVATASSHTTNILPLATSQSPVQQPSLVLPNCKVYATGNQLGFSLYGEVLEVEYEGKIYAAKKYRHVHKAKLFSVFGEKNEILAAIRHPNIVPYFGICQLDGDGSSVIVMEMLEMNLSTYLEDPDNVNISLGRKVQVLSDIVQGLNHLHCQRPAIIHRDLTATNVLLDSKGVAKIGDFGNSRMVDFTLTPELMTSKPGTLDYMSPEALEGGIYNEKLDVFSFGHLALYTVIQHRPHPLLGPKFKKDGLLVPRTEVERRQVYFEEVKTKLGNGEHLLFLIITGCLHDEPDHRPSCPDILQVLESLTRPEEGNMCNLSEIPAGVSSIGASHKDQNTKLGKHFSKQIYEQEMQYGYIDLGIDKVVMYGIAGSGKTCSLAALLGQPPPEVRCSTPLMQRPVQVMVIIVDDEMQWLKMTRDQIRQMIAKIIRSRAKAAHSEAIKSSHSNDSQQQSETTVSQPHPPTRRNANMSASEATITPHPPTDVSISTTPFSPHRVSNGNSTPPAQSTSEVTLDSLLELSDFEEKFVSLINDSNPSPEPIFQQNWLYVIDSGGQHEFHEVLPIFLNGASDFIFVLKVHESLDQRPNIAFHDSTGKLVCKPHPSFLTNEEIFKQCLRSMCSFTSKNKKSAPPQILFLGTHRDMVKEEDLPKVLESLNKRLMELLPPHFKEQVIFCDETMENLTFAINAEHPEGRDRECIQNVRRILTSKLGRRRVNVPLRWHALEEKLRQIAEAMKVTVLSRRECQKIAHSLRIDNESCEEALNFFNGVNLLFYFSALLPNLVFIEPQVVLDKVSELVKKSHQMKQGGNAQQPRPKIGEWQKFRDYGQVTEKFLNDPEFSAHYRPPIFTPKELITLIKSLLVFAELSNGVWFMPSLLKVASKDVAQYRVSHETALVIYFPEDGPQNGMFCSMVAYVLSPDNHTCPWEVLKDESGAPKCLTRNVIMFKVKNFAGSVTFIDCFTHFEVHVNTQPKKRVEFWKLVKCLVFAGLRKASEILGYAENFNPAIICPEHRSDPHPAALDDEGEWICSCNNEVFGAVEPNTIPWLAVVTKGTEATPATTTSMQIPRTAVKAVQKKKRNKKPDLPTLEKFPHPSRYINIMQEVVLRYKQLGNILLQSPNGTKVLAIEMSHPRSVKDVVYGIFQNWLMEDVDASWGKLVQCLKDVDLNSLAQEIESCLV